MKAIISIDARAEKIPKNSQIDVYISNEFETDDPDGFMLNISQERMISQKKVIKKGYDILAWVHNAGKDCHITLWVSDTKESYFEVSEKKELLFHAKKPRQ